MERTSPPAIRPFGAPADLDLDFGQADRPGLVTALLAACSTERDSGFWWAQPLGARIEALLRLLAASEQASQISLSARCGRARCGGAFEFELPPAALPGAGEPGPVQVALGHARAVTLRRPTGADLRAWRLAPAGSRAQAVAAILAALVTEGTVEPHEEAAVSQALATHDPLVAFTVECACPACGASNNVEIDLEALVLARLAARQRALLREIHTLAAHYGWTEGEALAVPARRRAQYLALIEEAQ
jgi:hypothetical protein